MGLSWSSRRRRNNTYYQNPHPPSQLISSSSSSSSYPYPSEPYPAPSPYAYPTHHPPPLGPPPLPGPPPPGPPPPPPPPIYSSYHYSGGYSACNYANPMVGRSNFVPYYTYQTNGWTGMRPPLPPPPRPQYVDHQHAKKVRNDVNVHKDTLKLEIDEQNPDHHLVSFVFDALFDGSITVFYFAKEEPNCKFVPLYAEAFMPVKIPFQKGLGQKFRQPSGTGIDLGFFALEDLSKQSPEEDVFPLVISAETCSASLPTDQHVSEPPPNSSSNTQITQAVIEKNNEGPFHVKVIRQILWIDGVRYELREIYGIGSSTAESFNDSDTGKECVICMTEPKDTAVLPCRHMCMCSECAKQLRLQSNKCPICRQPIEELMEIKINNVDQ
ncbi:probable E3 ubiquitin-protein ligase LUL4 [Cornus florida]|uniref:probable E3 ubiquitin-protein ligase LUL4 n=1 Tax=Cornus florida TaxID=4283 RepID=UPI0028995B8C|nr:probable E3 ubiquitin-protein ligase LUL4 [Cornus florida]